MNMKRTAGLAFGLAALLAFSGQASAEDEILVMHNSYRTGPFAGSGIPNANGVRDYIAMINARDGGVNGVKINMQECETGYDTKKSIECYEEGKAKGSVIYAPWSTGATLAAIPRAHIDKIPILSMAYGLSAAADGAVFPWVFNPPATYWDGASVFVRYIAGKEGGLEKLKGKTVGLVHLDAPYGKEPIPVLEALAKKYGFNLKLYPVAPTEMQNQSSLWLSIRRDRPDWLYMMGWGAMTPTAVREAVRTGYPMDHFISVWWPGEDDVRGAGPQAKGFKVITWHQVGNSFKAIQDIEKLVVDKGQSLTQKDKVGEHAYMHGVYEAVMIVEAVRNAQKLTGKKVINAEDMRRGLETLNITTERWKELGLDGYTTPLRISCADHNGHNDLVLIEWDGTKWVKGSDPISPLREAVDPLIEGAAKSYSEQNSGWPKRTETCDQRS